MNNTLELRSTFRFTEALSELPTLSISNPSFSKQKVKKSEPTDLKKNKIAVATQIAQTLRENMDEEMKSILEPYITKRLASLIRNKFNNDDILSINTSVEGFELGINKDACSHLKDKCFIRQGAHKGDILFHLEGFVPCNKLKAPEEATNFKISTKLVSISKFQFDRLSNQYYPLAIDTHGLVEEHETSMLPLIKIQTQPISARLYMSEVQKEIDSVNTVMISTIKYYKYQDGKFEHLAKNGCMNISKVL